MQVPRVSICWQYIRANEDKLRSPKMINGPRGPMGDEERVFADAFTDFTVNRALLMAGTLLLRNAIVRECLPWCHGRTSVDVRYLGKWNYNRVL